MKAIGVTQSAFHFLGARRTLTLKLPHIDLKFSDRVNSVDPDQTAIKKQSDQGLHIADLDALLYVVKKKKNTVQMLF